MEISIRLKNEQEISLKVKPPRTDDSEQFYRLVPVTGGKELIVLYIEDNQFKVLEIDPEIGETDESLRQKLEELIVALNPVDAALGIEESESEEDDEIGNSTNPYDPDKIRVDNKTFSLRQIYDMILSEDIDLSPDFQRKLVWDKKRKSRLIESILLRIPLPMFYFAQDNDGKLSVVDGLQRLSAIRDFMNNEFKLTNLEYLQPKCGGKYYSGPDKGQSIDAKYFRWFNMTQIVVNVIDPSSPFKLKYDIFRRINTGGQPLNSQEIRNCLSSKHLRDTLRAMAKSQNFVSATGGSVKDVRMEGQELALRFILFHKKYTQDRDLKKYSGNIESELNELTEEIGKTKGQSLDVYLHLFENSMLNANHLFGEFCFRKCQIEHLKPGARKQQINKALFVSISVLLANYPTNQLTSKIKYGGLALPLAQLITNNNELLYFLTNSTNSKANIQAIFKEVSGLLDEHIK